MEKPPYERATLKHLTTTSLVKPKAYVLIPALRKRLAADLAPQRLKFRVKVPNLSSLEFTFIGLRSLTDQEKVRELENYVRALKVHTICGLTIEFDARYTTHTFTSDKKKLCVSVTLHALNGNILFNSGLLEAPPPPKKTEFASGGQSGTGKSRPPTASFEGSEIRRMSGDALAASNNDRKAPREALLICCIPCSLGDTFHTGIRGHPTQASVRRTSARRGSSRRRISTKGNQKRQGIFVDSHTFTECKESSEERQIREVAIENNLHFSQMEKIKRLFEKTDADGSGEIEQGEFDDMVRSLSKAKDAYDLPRKILDSMWYSVCIDLGKTTMTLADFTRWYVRTFGVENQAGQRKGGVSATRTVAAMTKSWNTTDAISDVADWTILYDSGVPLENILSNGRTRAPQRDPGVP